MKGRMKMVYLFLADGFEEIEALTQVDYLRRAGVEIVTVGVTGEYVTGTRNIVVKADMVIENVNDLDKAQMLILPGGLGGTKGMENCKKITDAVVKAYENGSYIAAICAAPTIFAHLGLLKGKRCVCYPDMQSELTKHGGIVENVPVVCDGKIITSRAAGSAEEFSFALIEVLCGDEVKEKIRKSIVAR